jgi:fructuronate reductase
MVDRIVPSMTEDKQALQSGRLGLEDLGAVGTEPFSQWIIEDNFAAGRPDWERAGVQLVADILPYENIKLRLLNASHSAIAYTGLLAGIETVDQVMTDAVLGTYIQRLMAEDLVPALEAPDGFDLDSYRDALLVRFGNPCLEHSCRQIAVDGTEKIRQRWLPALQQAQLPGQLLKALAAWCYFILNTDLPVEDPRESRLLELRDAGECIDRRLEVALDCVGISPGSIPCYKNLREILLQNLDILEEKGVGHLLS